MVNYTGKLRDVQTLAHELGHGVHQFLSRPQGIFQASTPLTMAETASVFGEMLVFQRVLSQLDDPDERLRMLVGKIDDTMATVFRQVALNRFEDAIHTARRTEGELSAKRFSELWIQTQSAMFEDSVKLSENYGLWWSYIPHFIHTPGYVYAYAFGELMVLALFAIYREQGEEFAEKYLRLLGAGGSDWPQNLLSQVGVDLGQADFWQKGLDIVEEMIREAEELSRNLDRRLSDSQAQAK
jgi:oligoendopeptidase F